MILSHRLFLCSALVLLTSAGGCEEKAAPVEGAITVPSGREVTFLDVITNVPGTEGATARFRFVAPGLAPEDAEPAAADMQVLCDSYALPRTDAMVPPPNQIVITLSAAAVPFGEAAPDVTQFFEAYAIEGGACIWQVF